MRKSAVETKLHSALKSDLPPNAKSRNLELNCAAEDIFDLSGAVRFRSVTLS